jgi:hypothetical protein
MGTFRRNKLDLTDEEVVEDKVLPWAAKAQQNWKRYQESERDGKDSSMREAVDLTCDSLSPSSSSSVSTDGSWLDGVGQNRNGNVLERKRVQPDEKCKKSRHRSLREEPENVPASRVVDLCNDDDEDVAFVPSSSLLIASSSSSSSSAKRRALVRASHKSDAVMSHDHRAGVISLTSPRDDSKRVTIVDFDNGASQQRRSYDDVDVRVRRRKKARAWEHADEPNREKSSEQVERKNDEQEKANTDKLHCSSTVSKAFTCPICLDELDKVRWSQSNTVLLFR